MTELTIVPVLFKIKRGYIKRKPSTLGKVRKGTKKQPGGKQRPKKEKVWKLKKADTHFSLKIRVRDGRCMHPIGCERKALLQNSHFFGRAIKSTRFDPDNCITLCWLHHYKDKLLGFEYQKQTIEKHGFDGGYTLFMKNHLGTEKYQALCDRAAVSIKQKQAIINYMATVA